MKGGTQNVENPTSHIRRAPYSASFSVSCTHLNSQQAVLIIHNQDLRQRRVIQMRGIIGIRERVDVVRITASGIVRLDLLDGHQAILPVPLHLDERVRVEFPRRRLQRQGQGQCEHHLRAVNRLDDVVRCSPVHRECRRLPIVATALLALVWFILGVNGLVFI